MQGSPTRRIPYTHDHVGSVFNWFGPVLYKMSNWSPILNRHRTRWAILDGYAAISCMFRIQKTIGRILPHRLNPRIAVFHTKHQDLELCLDEKIFGNCNSPDQQKKNREMRIGDIVILSVIDYQAKGKYIGVIKTPITYQPNILPDRYHDNWGIMSCRRSRNSAK